MWNRTAPQRLWAAALAIGCFAFAPAQAEYVEPGVSGRSAGAGVPTAHTTWAKVLRVEPLHRSVKVVTPHEECWDQPVRRYRTGGYGHPGYYSYTPTIIGSILGGVIGNQFGRGSGNVAATAAGAVLGGSVARDVQYQNRYQHAARQTYTTYERRCETVHSYEQKRQPDGFLVDYEYNGRVYTAHTHHHPGTKIRVNVSVVPQG